MSITITGITTHDLRFPTSKSLDGSDAVNQDPDYSAAHVVLHTNMADLKGKGLTFTIGRGNDVCVHAIESMAHLVIGRTLSDIKSNMGKVWKEITSGDSQLRWLGPDKGAMHLASAAIVNALWDLWSKADKKPTWQLVAEMSPEELHRCIDYSYIQDEITPEQGLAMLQKSAAGKAERIAYLKQHGYPAYTTSAGWLGYEDKKLRRLCQQCIDDGWTHIKLKVGVSLKDDIRRCRIAREVIGPERNLMIDANQIWEVNQAIKWVNALQQFKPWFIEEPTSPDDILGHKAIKQGVAPVQVATGEHCHNRVMFKQFLQADAIDVVQIDSCRLAGVSEVLAVMMLAHKFNKPVCPHAGGVGLCEYVQHLSMIDYVCISGTMEGRIIEYVNHLGEHFTNPAMVKNSRYIAPTEPGYTANIKDKSIAQFTYPTGSEWQ